MQNNPIANIFSPVLISIVNRLYPNEVKSSFYKCFFQVYRYTKEWIFDVSLIWKKLLLTTYLDWFLNDYILDYSPHSWLIFKWLYIGLFSSLNNGLRCISINICFILSFIVIKNTFIYSECLIPAQIKDLLKPLSL